MDGNFIDIPQMTAGQARRVISRNITLIFAVIFASILTGRFVGGASFAQDDAFTVTEVARYAQCQRELGEIERVVKALHQEAASRAGPTKIIQVLSESAPERVWLNSVQFREGQVEVNGRGITDQDVQKFVAHLESQRLVDTVTVLSSLLVSHADDEMVSFRILLTMRFISPDLKSG